MIQIRGRSQNVERGLCPSGRSGSKDKANTVHHFIDHDGGDFVSLASALMCAPLACPLSSPPLAII